MYRTPGLLGALKRPSLYPLAMSALISASKVPLERSSSVYRSLSKGCRCLRVVTDRLDRGFRGLNKVPANQAAGVVRAFAGFLVALRTQDIDRRFVCNFLRPCAQSNGDLLIARHGSVYPPHKFHIRSSLPSEYRCASKN